VSHRVLVDKENEIIDSVPIRDGDVERATEYLEKIKADALQFGLGAEEWEIKTAVVS
jgi:hypothetical protein